MKTLIFFLAACLVSCAPSRTIGIEEPAAPWLAQAVDRAIFFWVQKPRQISFILVENWQEADTVIRMSDEMPEHAAGFYSMGRIGIRPRVEEWATIDQICIVSHELGHSRGLDHVEDDDSLMSPVTSGFREDCSWSAFDQREFCQTNDCG